VIERGRGFVAVRWEDMAVVAVYVSPNIGQAEYASFLDELAACVMRLRGRPSLVLGDFNAHATAWGSRRTNRRGER
jgi:endonuclease/exonuclease/phosphatase (EEP) superfamily protein YafD